MQERFTLFLLISSLAVGCGDPVCDEGTLLSEGGDECLCPEGQYPDHELGECRLSEADVDASLLDVGQTDRTDQGFPPDAGSDVGSDAGSDAGPPPMVVVRFPWNGFTTGGFHNEGALRPNLIWTGDADHFQVQMTQNCEVSSFLGCSFDSVVVDETTRTPSFRPGEALPVSTVAPVGARYFWRVRGCSSADQCSSWSHVRYLDVGRDPGDYNGDGFADLAIGASQQDNPEDGEGVVFTYDGGPDGISADPTQTIDNPADQVRGGFGSGLASAGDLNGDGFADLLVGARARSTPEHLGGAVYVFLGSRNGLEAVPSVTIHSPKNQELGDFGGSVSSAGDVNGDGYADLIIGARNHDSDEEEDVGYAYLFFGNASGAAISPGVSLENPLNQLRGYFGYVVRGVGDVNGDGYPDIAVSAPRQDNPETDEGVVYLYFGGESGVDTTPDMEIDNPTDSTPSIPNSANFGSSIAGWADFNQDGLSDVAIGAQRQASAEARGGHAYIFFGAMSGPTSTPSVVLRNPTNQAYAAMGESIASCDVTGDGLADLIVGAGGQHLPEHSEGAIHVFVGTGEGVSPTAVTTIDNPENQMSGLFGGEVACLGDINGDGRHDLGVGAKFQDSPAPNSGSVFLFHAMETLADPDFVLTNPTNQPGGVFGVSIAQP